MSAASVVPVVPVVLFASGSGSNAESIIHASLRTDAPFRVVLLVSNNSQCLALLRAQMFDIPTLHLSTSTHPVATEFSAALLQALEPFRGGIIALAGYMKKLPSDVIERFTADVHNEKNDNGTILNIHPALLPEFGGQGMYGMNVHRAVLAAQKSESGLTIHNVTADYDTGTIVRQERVPVLPDDTPESLAERINACELEVYPALIRELAQKKRAASTRPSSTHSK
jgi:phosphoribosylglycinamide formyltransferase 1